MTGPTRRTPPRANTMGIDFNGIAGICPFRSTLADVLRLHGNGYEVEIIPPYQGKRRIHPGKRVLIYRAMHLQVVFHEVDGELPATAPVTVVGVDEGSSLRTEDGLIPGMTVAKAERIIERNYRVHYQSTYCIEIIPADGIGDTMLGLYPADGVITFVGLYRRD